MGKIKENFLKTIKWIASFVSILAVVLTILSGTMVIFYDELTEIFMNMGMSQERLTWLTLTLGGLGTSGVIMTRIAGGLRTALVMTKTENELAQANYERKLSAEVASVRRESDLRIDRIEQAADKRTEILEQELATYRQKIEAQELFDKAQAYKYINAPGHLVDEKTKEAYRDYLIAIGEEI